MSRVATIPIEFQANLEAFKAQWQELLQYVEQNQPKLGSGTVADMLPPGAQAGSTTFGGLKSVAAQQGVEYVPPFMRDQFPAAQQGGASAAQAIGREIASRLPQMDTQAPREPGPSFQIGRGYGGPLFGISGIAPRLDLAAAQAQSQPRPLEVKYSKTDPVSQAVTQALAGSTDIGSPSKRLAPGTAAGIFAPSIAAQGGELQGGASQPQTVAQFIAAEIAERQKQLALLSRKTEILAEEVAAAKPAGGKAGKGAQPAAGAGGVTDTEHAQWDKARFAADLKRAPDDQARIGMLRERQKGLSNQSPEFERIEGQVADLENRQFRSFLKERGQAERVKVRRRPPAAPSGGTLDDVLTEDDLVDDGKPAGRKSFLTSSTGLTRRFGAGYLAYEAIRAAQSVMDEQEQLGLHAGNLPAQIRDRLRFSQSLENLPIIGQAASIYSRGLERLPFFGGSKPGDTTAAIFNAGESEKDVAAGAHRVQASTQDAFTAAGIRRQAADAMTIGPLTRQRDAIQEAHLQTIEARELHERDLQNEIAAEPDPLNRNRLQSALNQYRRDDGAIIRASLVRQDAQLYALGNVVDRQRAAIKRREPEIESLTAGRFGAAGEIRFSNQQQTALAEAGEIERPMVVEQQQQDRAEREAQQEEDLHRREASTRSVQLRVEGKPLASQMNEIAERRRVAFSDAPYRDVSSYRVAIERPEEGLANQQVNQHVTDQIEASFAASTAEAQVENTRYRRSITAQAEGGIQGIFGNRLAARLAPLRTEREIAIERDKENADVLGQQFDVLELQSRHDDALQKYNVGFGTRQLIQSTRRQGMLNDLNPMSARQQGIVDEISNAIAHAGVDLPGEENRQVREERIGALRNSGTAQLKQLDRQLQFSARAVTADSVFSVGGNPNNLGFGDITRAEEIGAKAAKEFDKAEGEAESNPVNNTMGGFTAQQAAAAVEYLRSMATAGVSAVAG